MDERLNEEYERLRGGRDLNPVDVSAVLAVAGLSLRVKDAQRMIAAEGIMLERSDGMVEHPALMVEKRASAEIRGWVKDRPDLFGEQKKSRPRREKPEFKIV
ncbi:hypothetical protein CCICO_04365 [Corynebacterium ciconiae DSM 44920]|uniref:terminase n=1 Tax=Corynebacterium ciconiae TaxID=227319 RepID=UPI002647B859|nr:terminase [Corynebacterium ciconiae]WKD60910.1 hypothetical protein CCICO_04365 [Corynebacterium ciconiae DSM 44920]